MRTRLDDIGTGVGILAFGVVVLSVLIPFGVVDPGHLRAGTISPTFWPKATGWMLVVFGALDVLEGILMSRTSSVVENSSDGSQGRAGAELLRACLSFIVLYASWAATFAIGLPITSALTILVFGALFGERRLWLLALIAVVVPVVLYYFFTHVAKVPIPLGTLFE